MELPHSRLKGTWPDREMGGQFDTQESRAERRHGRSPVASARNPQPIRPSWPTRARTTRAGLDERRRLERALHDGVQNELVALILELALAAHDPDTPPALASTLAGLEARAQVALDSVRDIARGIYPSLLADLGLREALLAQAVRAPINVSLVGNAPRSTEEAEDAVYFSCSEAIQNASKHAGRTAQVTLRLRYDQGSLAVHVADDGRGFDPAGAPDGAGLQNIRDRIRNLGGSFRVASDPGRGTVLTLSLPWPRRPDVRR